MISTMKFGAEGVRIQCSGRRGGAEMGRREWYRDGRVYGGASLLLALISILFGVHKLARITIVVSGLSFAVLQIWGDAIREILTSWARGG